MRFCFRLCPRRVVRLLSPREVILNLESILVIFPSVPHSSNVVSSVLYGGSNTLKHNWSRVLHRFQTTERQRKLSYRRRFKRDQQVESMRHLETEV